MRHNNRELKDDETRKSRDHMVLQSPGRLQLYGTRGMAKIIYQPTACWWKRLFIPPLSLMQRSLWACAASGQRPDAPESELRDIELAQFDVAEKDLVKVLIDFFKAK